MSTPRKNPAKPLRILEDIRSHRYRQRITKSWLMERWLSNLTLPQIAQEAGCGVSTIQYYGRRYNLPDRPRRRYEKGGYDPVLTEEFLQAAYVDDELGAQQIAADVGCSISRVVRYLEAHGIPRRGHQPGVDNLLYEDKITAEFIESRLRQQANVRDMSREVGCSTTTVALAVRRHGLQDLASSVRPPEPSCASREELRRLYVEEKMSMTAIGRLLGASKTKVRADLSRFGIRHYSRPGFKATDDAWLATRQVSEGA